MAARRPPKNQLAEVLESGLPEGCNSLVDFLHQYTVDQLTGKTQGEADIQAEALREKCRNGNPFPLVALQWPELVVSDPSEAIYFEGAIGDPENPCLRLDSWQREIIAGYFDDLIVEIGIKGNTKAGKGTSTAIGVNLWFDVWQESKIILTSSDYEHAAKNIYGEVRMWRNRMMHPGPGRVGAEGITDAPEHYIAVRNPLKDEGFSGQHGPRTLFVFDESSGVRDGLYENAQKQFRKIVALSNPRVLFGWFRNLFKRCKDENKTEVVTGDYGRRLCVTVGGLDCLNVQQKRLEKPIAPPGGVTIDDRTFAHGEEIPSRYYVKVKPLIPNQCDYGRYMGISQHPDSRHVDVYAHGKFPTEDPTKQVILQSWLEFHEKAWNAHFPPAPEAFGLDVARSLDGDSTCFAAGGQAGITGLTKWKYADTTHTTAEVLRMAREVYGIELRQSRHPVSVDMDGLGAGVGDQLKAAGVWVIEFRGNAVSQVDPKTYANMRTEGYATLGRRLNPDDRWRGIAWAIPPSDSLRQELCAPEKMYSADGLRFGLTPKNRPPDRDDIISVKEKIGRSPDEADAVVYLWNSVRILHNLNEWFRHSSAPLIVFPAPAPAAPAEGQGQGDATFPLANGAAVPQQPPAPENPNYAYLREQYGRLIGRDASDPMRDGLGGERKPIRPIEGPGADSTFPASPAAAVPQQPEPAKKDNWLSRVKWSEE